MPQEKMTMDQVRERFPEYDDMDDMSLANALHGKFYSDIPIAEFYASVGFNPEMDAGDNGIYSEVRPGFSQDNPIDPATIDRSTPEGQALVASLTRGTWVKGADGTVYALPDDAREGVVRTGDEPLSPGLMQRPQSGVEDVAKSFPTGVVEGLTGLAGMQGTIGQMIGGQPGQFIPGFGIVGPSGEQLNEQIREGLGRDYYQPQTMAGEYSRTLGEFLPGAAAPGGLAARAASVAVPAVASESAGQLARALSGGERDTAAEGLARMGGGLIGGLGVGGVNAVRSGADNVLRGAAEGVTPDQLAMAAALRARSPVPLTNAEALQQVTGGATGMGRVQRVVEGASPRLAPMMANRPARVEQAIGGVLDQIAPQTPGPQVAGQAQTAAGGVLNRMRQRVNESAEPFYASLPGQTVDEGAMAFLNQDPTYQAASRQLMGQPELAALVAAPPNDLSTINRVIQQMDELEEAARPAIGNTQANRTLSAQRGSSAEIAQEIASQASPDYRMALQTGATGRSAFVDPLARGPIGAIAGEATTPNLAGQTRALFPSQPFEGQADETAQALRLMGEVDPSVSGPLVRQFLAQQAAEAGQANIGGANPFGGAKFAAQTFGNPLQRDTVLGAVDVAAPQASRDIRDLVEALSATGQRESAGSNTSFNTQMLQDLRGGNAATGAAQSITNPLGVFSRVAGGIDDWTARRNAQTLADLLVANSDEFNARLTRAINRPRGANRIRAAVAVGAGQED